MEYKTDVVLDLEGNAVSGATVLILKADGVTPATIYNAAGALITNPVQTDSKGAFGLAVANGKYYAQVSVSGPVLAKYGPVTFFDPAELIVTQQRTGNFYSHAGARINRLNDRVFIGRAVDNDGAMPNVTKDWLTDFQIAAGLGNGSIVSAQHAVLTDTNNQAAVATLSGAQTLAFINEGASCIGNSTYVVHNSATLGAYAWGFYAEAHKTGNATGAVYGAEFNTRTLFSTISPDPYQQGEVVGLQLASGAGLSATGQFDASAAIQIEDNPVKWKKGIVFGAGAITGTDGLTGTGIAIALAKGHHAEWYSAAGVPRARIGSTAAADSVALDFADGKLVARTLAGATLFELSNAGRISIGGAPTVGRTVEATKAVTGSAIGIGFRSAGQAQSDVTSEYRLYATSASTQAATFTLTSLSHYNAAQGAFGAGSAVTEQHGFYAAATLTGAVSNFAFRSDLPAGTGRWAFYNGGGANSAYAGNSKFGATTAPTAKVDIAAGTAAAGTAPLKLAAGVNLTTPETGTFEFDGTNLYFTVGGVRKTVTLV